MEHFHTFAIGLTIWGLIQSGLVFEIDRNPIPTVRWFIIFLTVSSGFLAAFHVSFKMRTWMFFRVPIYEKWALARFARRRPGVIPPLSGLMFGFVGILAGPIFAIGLSQLFRPQTPAFQAAWVGLLAGIV